MGKGQPPAQNWTWHTYPSPRTVSCLGGKPLPSPPSAEAQATPSAQPPHHQVKTLEGENQRKSQEVIQLQFRGAQEAQQQQQSRQQALELQRLAAEAEAAREGAQREVGTEHPRADGLTGAPWPQPGALAASVPNQPAS